MPRYYDSDLTDAVATPRERRGPRAQFDPPGKIGLKWYEDPDQPAPGSPYHKLNGERKVVKLVKRGINLGLVCDFDEPSRKRTNGTGRKTVAKLVVEIEQVDENGLVVPKRQPKPIRVYSAPPVGPIPEDLTPADISEPWVGGGRSDNPKLEGVTFKPKVVRRKRHHRQIHPKVAQAWNRQRRRAFLLG